MTAYVGSGNRWELDSVSLSTLATWVVSVDEEWPQARGADAVAPMLPGERWRPKVVDARRLSLTVAVSDRDEDGVFGGATRLRTNLDRLAGLVSASRTRLLTLRRKMPDDTWREAQVQVLSSVAVERRGTEAGGLAKAVLDLHMPSVWWLGSSVTSAALPTGAATLTVAGSAPQHELAVRFSGPCTDPWLKTSSLDPAVTLSWLGVIPAGDWVEVAIPGRTARWKAGGSAGWGRLSGSDAFGLVPGSNVLTVSAGTGSVVVTYRPAYA